MGSPPPPSAALDIPSFTPSHPLTDRLLTFTDLLLSNIEEWNKPHPFWPPPLPPVSFPGSDRFIKGLLPHRTSAISASLSSLLPDTASLLDCCKHGDGHDHKQADIEPFQIHDVIQLPDDDHHSDGHDQMQVDTALSQAALATHVHSETSDLPSNKIFNSHRPLHSQADKSVVDIHLNDSITTEDRVYVSTDVRSEDDNNCTYSQDAGFSQIGPSHGSSEVVFPVDGPNDGLCEVVEAERPEETQPNDLDCSFSTMELTENSLQNAEAPCNSQLNEQADDLEEGELSERLSDDEQPNFVEEGNLERITNILERKPAEGSNVQEGSPSDSSRLGGKVVECGTDDEMNEPISSFVSRYRSQSLLNFANQKPLLHDASGEPMNMRISRISCSSEDKQKGLEETCLVSTGKPEQVKILQEVSRVSNSRDVIEAQRLVETQSDSSMTMKGPSVSYDKGRIDGGMGTISKTLEQQGYAESQQPESSGGLFLSVADKGLCLPIGEAGKVEELATLKVAKKKKRGPLTETRRKKRQKGKHRAQDRKSAQLGVRKLKFKPCVEKEKEKQKKTCPYYVQGRCSKGTSCKLAHEATPKTKSEKCKYFVTNCCLKGDDCPFSHTLSSFPCKYYHTTGRCMEGDSCRFSHEPLIEEAKQEFLRKLQEEQKVRQGVSGGLGPASLNRTISLRVASSSEMSNSRTTKFLVKKDQEAVKDSLQAKHVDCGKYSTLVEARRATSMFTRQPVNAANKSGKESPVLHRAIEPSPDRGTGTGSDGQQKVVDASVSGNKTAQERRTRAEAFLQAQLEPGRFSHRSRHAMGMENANQYSGSPTNQLRALPMGHATSIRVSSMSPLCKLNVKSLNAHSGSPQERGPKGESGTAVPESSPTLLDLLMRPQEKTLSKETHSTPRPQSTEANAAVLRSASTVFLDKLLK